MDTGSEEMTHTPPPLPNDSNTPSRNEELLAEVYDQLRALAEGYLRRERADHTLQPTALVHEAFLRLAEQDPRKWNDGEHFMALAAQVMRRVLVDHARRHRSAKRGGDHRRVTLSDVGTDSSEIDLLALDDALSELATLNPRQARVVELRFFAGLSLDEVARYVGVARSTIGADWQMARAWLNNKLSAT